MSIATTQLKGPDLFWHRGKGKKMTTLRFYRWDRETFGKPVPIIEMCLKEFSGTCYILKHEDCSIPEWASANVNSYLKADQIREQENEVLNRAFMALRNPANPPFKMPSALRKPTDGSLRACRLWILSIPTKGQKEVFILEIIWPCASSFIPDKINERAVGVALPDEAKRAPATLLSLPQEDYVECPLIDYRISRLHKAEQAKLITEKVGDIPCVKEILGKSIETPDTQRPNQNEVSGATAAKLCRVTERTIRNWEEDKSIKAPPGYPGRTSRATLTEWAEARRKQKSINQYARKSRDSIRRPCHPDNLGSNRIQEEDGEKENEAEE
jgi:hypothetical protein